MAVISGRLDPPIAAGALDPLGMHSNTWSNYHQELADRVTGLPAAVRKGAVDGSDAAAGDIGEYLTASFGSVTLPDSVATDVGSLPLPAGDWDVWGTVVYASSSSNMRTIQAWVGATPVSGAAGPGRAILATSSPVLATGIQLATGTLRISLAAPGAAYLSGLVVSTSGAVTASGAIAARRAR